MGVNGRDSAQAGTVAGGEEFKELISRIFSWMTPLCVYSVIEN